MPLLPPGHRGQSIGAALFVVCVHRGRDGRTSQASGASTSNAPNITGVVTIRFNTEGVVRRRTSADEAGGAITGAAGVAGVAIGAAVSVR